MLVLMEFRLVLAGMVHDGGLLSFMVVLGLVLFSQVYKCNGTWSLQNAGLLGLEMRGGEMSGGWLEEVEIAARSEYVSEVLPRQVVCLLLSFPAFTVLTR